MAEREDLLQAVADTISDYREDDEHVNPPTAEHVDTWIGQFSPDAQLPMLRELNFVFKKTYTPKNRVVQFLEQLVVCEKLTFSDPHSFWRNINFLKIQNKGNSQNEILQLFDDCLRAKTSLTIENCGNESNNYMYIDDGIFSGWTIINDISRWLKTTSLVKIKLYVAVIASHLGGQHHANTEIQKFAKTLGKDVEISWEPSIEIEDRKSCTRTSDVLRPTHLPDDEQTKEYAQSLKYPPVLRTPGHVGKNNFFSSEEGRNVLEQEFLLAGVKIRAMCPNLNEYQRPLGNMVLQTLGFGSLFATYRNCPNNCPLALWAGDPWYPLLPRNTN